VDSPDQEHHRGSDMTSLAGVLLRATGTRTDFLFQFFFVARAEICTNIVCVVVVYVVHVYVM
jgi:hypothetical protein